MVASGCGLAASAPQHPLEVAGHAGSRREQALPVDPDPHVSALRRAAWHHAHGALRSRRPGGVPRPPSRVRPRDSLPRRGPARRGARRDRALRAAWRRCPGSMVPARRAPSSISPAPAAPRFSSTGPRGRGRSAAIRVDALHLPAWGVPPGSCRSRWWRHSTTPRRSASRRPASAVAAAPARGWRVRSLRRARLVHAVSGIAGHELQAARRVVRRADRRPSTWGVGPPFSPAPAPLPPRHLLFVGGAEAHKNLDVVLRALRLPGADGPAAAGGRVRRRPGAGPRAPPGAGACRGPRAVRPGARTTNRSPSSTGRPSPSWCRRGTRGSACRRSRRWRAAVRWSRHGPAHSPRCAAMPPTCSTPTTPRPGVMPSAPFVTGRSCGRRGSPPASSAPPPWPWSRTARGLLEVYRAATRRPSARI